MAGRRIGSSCRELCQCLPECLLPARPAPSPVRRRLLVGATDATASTPTDEERRLLELLAERTIIEILESAGGLGGATSIGSVTDQGKTSFANKSTRHCGAEVDLEAAAGLGVTCRKGLKPESLNQVSWFVLKTEERSIYAVFDGHGQKGAEVSEFAKDTLPKLLVKDPRFKSGEDLPSLLKDVFKQTQGLLGAADRMKKLSCQMSGTTAAVCVHEHHGQGKVWVAHAGHTLAILGRRAQADAVKLTQEHKPNLPDERRRIEQAGGRVVFDGYANHRIYAKNGRYPGLNMSRTLGDLIGHVDCGITCEPEVLELSLKPGTDLLLVLGSNGIFEFMTEGEVAVIANEYPPTLAADRLAKEAWDRWTREEGGAVVADLTAIVVKLPQPPETTSQAPEAE